MLYASGTPVGTDDNNIQPTMKELKTALNRLYMETLQATGDGWWHKVESVHLQNALANAAHMLGYHNLCESGLCIYRDNGFD